MKESFYDKVDPETALEIYFQGENELYAQIKNDIIRKTLTSVFLKTSVRPLKVLEIGAAGGAWTEYFLKEGCEVTCVDVSGAVLEGNAKLHPAAKFILADATDVLLNDRFDLIFIKDVIEHIKDDRLFLENMNNHLKNDGMIMINTQNSFSLNYLIQGAYHFLKGDRKWHGWDPTHLRFYNVISLKKKLLSADFKPVKWFGSYYFPYRVLADRLKIKRSCKPFCFTELLGLYDKFPFNMTGWNIGVICRKTNTI